MRFRVMKELGLTRVDDSVRASGAFLGGQRRSAQQGVESSSKQVCSTVSHFAKELNMSKLCCSTLTIFAVLATGLLLAGQTNAAPQTSPQGHEAMGATSPEAHLQMLSEKLNLTEDQKAKLKPILQDQAQQMKAMRDDTSLTPEQKSAKKKIIHETTHDQINSVLTPEQQEKFKEMKREGMEKHKDMNHQ